jgi:hypothetical protein
MVHQQTNCEKTFRSKYHCVTSRGIDTLEVEDDDNDTNILDEVIKAPKDSDYHEPQPQHPNSTINHPPRS